MSRCDQCNKESDKALQCPQCLQTKYCSEACRQAAWVQHEAVCNTIEVPRSGMTAFVPYFGEGNLPQEIEERINETGPSHQTYITYHYRSNGVLEQNLIEANVSFGKGGSKVGYGADPGTLGKTKYDLRISVEPEVGMGMQTVVIPDLSIGETAIYTGSKTKAGELAKMNFTRAVNADTTTLVMWPGTERLMQAIGQNPQFVIPSTGASMKIEMVVNGQTAMDIHGVLCFEKFTGGRSGFLKRTFKSLLPFQSEFQRKLGKNSAIRANLNNLEMLRATDQKGNSVQLIFEVTRDKQGVPVDEVSLLDVEFRTKLRPLQYMAQRSVTGAEGSDSLPPSPSDRDDMDDTQSESESMGFQLDANNVEHMNGLIAAMEEQMADGGLQEFQNTFVMLKAHRERLESGEEGYEAPREVHAAVHAVGSQMFRNIGLRWKSSIDKNYYKLHRNDPIEALQDEVRDLKLPAPGEKNFKQKLISWGKGSRGKAKGRMRAILKIINERMLQLDRDSPTRKELADMRSQLNTVLNA